MASHWCDLCGHFSTEFGVKHCKVTPYHPEANVEVEQFNRTWKKTIQAAIADGKNWHTVLENFLLAYRTTPHATTGIAPFELMFGRMSRALIQQQTRNRMIKPYHTKNLIRRKIFLFRNQRTNI
ncbi:uncharacterized protein K02A2.6-like [Hydractinia symbiolongicarpus]|uniref:uncharacterized protein K02A2.6-like n=1 Tax=Hydractinia symbiolongicarpus TaxID=13093 RepID=UPI00254BB1E9|nr:uncharacterized protein K02A2.6-like [Hydractinia symbiolongicarpus]